LPLYYKYSGQQSTFEFEHLVEFGTEFESTLGDGSGVRVAFFDEKARGRKPNAIVPFRVF
jgi:hypothetical protein